MSFARLYELLTSDIDYESVISFITPYLNNSDTYIDAGCGTGALTVPLLEKGYKVIGIDIDTEMLSILENKLREKSLFTPLYEHDIRQNTGIKVNGILLFNDVINYFKGVKGVFEALKKSLTPNGFVLLDLYKESYLDVMAHYQEVEESPIFYTWKTEVKNATLVHRILTQDESYQIDQYIYPLSYYENILRDLGFNVTVLKGPDERKHYIYASL